MKPLKEFDISFTGMKPGNYQFEYHIDKKFFEAFNFEEYLNSDVDVVLDFVKKTNMLELHFSSKGNVEVPCDITTEVYEQPVEGDLNLVVKFGAEYNDDEDELLILPFEEYHINVAQYIYEMIVLAMPSKRIHPGIADGTLKSEILERLEEYQSGTQKEKNEIDPRWEALKKLITNKNT